MALFNRRRNQSLSELESYYAARRGRSGTAWLMALLSLVVTVAILAGLFFGGRWVYRALRDNNGSNTSDTTSDVVVGTVDENGNVQGSVGNNDSSNVSVDDSGDQNTDFPGVVTDEAASTDTPSDETAADSNVGSVAGENTDLPNTGAGEVLFIAPILAFAVGYIISRKRQLS